MDRVIILIKNDHISNAIIRIPYGLYNLFRNETGFRKLRVHVFIIRHPEPRWQPSTRLQRLAFQVEKTRVRQSRPVEFRSATVVDGPVSSEKLLWCLDRRITRTCYCGGWEGVGFEGKPPPGPPSTTC